MRPAETYDTTFPPFARLIGQATASNPAPSPTLCAERFVTRQRAIARRLENQTLARFASSSSRWNLHIDKFIATGAGASDFGRNADAIFASPSLAWGFARDFQVRLAPRALKLEGAPALFALLWGPTWRRHLFWRRAPPAALTRADPVHATNGCPETRDPCGITYLFIAVAHLRCAHAAAQRVCAHIPCRGSSREDADHVAVD